jgi:bifunctional UDP-N-acetylglucosamine pyrophosphorylase / glucosamine-1-phosphate N-acetyltransferase
VKAKVSLSHNIVKLLEKGVQIPSPFSIDVGEEIIPERIDGDDVAIYPGTRIYGAKTLISRGTKLGYEAPATIVDCQTGSHVELRGGFFKSSVFLAKAAVASGAQIREGCILEEEANANHTVGLKQTILFPFVTLGSLINFCDCFMSGGTSRNNHSEVGSSYIHFNYTPNQDKATPSLIGDVPRGVMLNQPPIFLGGQGGLVGPVRIGYGSVIAAGVVCRKDCPQGNRVITESDVSTDDKSFRGAFYKSIKHRVYNNICYIANLLALKQWYIQVRQPFFRREDMGGELYAGAIEKLDIAIEERLKRFRDLSEKMDASIEMGKNEAKKRAREKLFKQQKEFSKNWPQIEEALTSGKDITVDLKNRHSFIKVIHNRMKDERDYIRVIQGLHRNESIVGTTWLQNIVDHIIREALIHLPSCKFLKPSNK